MGMEELKALRRKEEKEVPGLRLRTPRQRLIDARETQAKNPDKHVRWVNIKDPEKAESRKEDGYTRLTSEEGGKQIGDQAALFAIPKEQAVEMDRAFREEHQARLDAHKAAMMRAAEEGAKALRDKAGLSVSAERLLINDAE